MVVNQNYIKKIFDVRFKLNDDDMLRLEGKIKPKQGQAKIVSDIRTLNRV